VRSGSRRPARGPVSTRGSAAKQRRSAEPEPTSTNQDPLSELIGSSPSIEEIRATIRKLVASGDERPRVLLEGEAGSDKSLVASLLRALGRPAAPVAVVDCAATPGDLVADLLFGAPVERGRPWFTPGAPWCLKRYVTCRSPPRRCRKALDRPPLRRHRGRPDHTWLITTCNIDMDAAMRQGYFARNLFRRLAEDSRTHRHDKLSGSGAGR